MTCLRRGVCKAQAESGKFVGSRAFQTAGARQSLRRFIMTKWTLLNITPDAEDELDPGGTTEDLENESNSSSGSGD